MFVNPGCCSPPFPEWRKSRLETLRWLVPRGIRLLGIEAFDFDAAPDYAGHRFLLERDVLIVEGLVNLAALSASEAQLYVVPLRLRGTGAAPCRVFAVED